MRSTTFPPCDFATSQAASAANTLPACIRPVGDGANRPTTGAGGVTAVMRDPYFLRSSTCLALPVVRSMPPGSTSLTRTPTRSTPLSLSSMERRKSSISWYESENASGFSSTCTVMRSRPFTVSTTMR